MAGLWRKFFDPRVADHLIADEGEIVIDEVRRHPMAFVGPIAVLAAGLVVLLLAFVVPIQVALVPIVAGLVIMVLGGYRMLSAHMDRFVITNMRVFRVRGIFAQHTATMPMSRILDISVHKPLLGRLFSYGHFVFESAAQDQGLRDIRYVARPDERDLTIQRVIQRSGLRSSMRPLTEHDDDHGDVDHGRHHRRGRRGRNRAEHDRNRAEHDRNRVEYDRNRAEHGGDPERVDFDLIEVEQDPSDGGSSRVATTADDAAWLAGGERRAAARDPVTGRPIPSDSGLARDVVAPTEEPDEAEHWTQAWSVRDEDEHRRARRQVAESEVAGRDLRGWLPGAPRVTLTEQPGDAGDRRRDRRDSAPSPGTSRRGGPTGYQQESAGQQQSGDHHDSGGHREAADRQVGDHPDNRS